MYMNKWDPAAEEKIWYRIRKVTEDHAEDTTWVEVEPKIWDIIYLKFSDHFEDKVYTEIQDNGSKIIRGLNE